MNVGLENKKMILDSLLSNFAINEAGDAAARPMCERLVERSGTLSFFVPDDMFELWLDEHSTFIGTRFNANESSSRLYGSRPKFGALSSRTYRCSCFGHPQVIHPDLEGGDSGKKRNRQPSKKQGCTASITAYFQANVPLGEGKVTKQTLIQYNYNHNHNLNAEDYLPQQRLSKQVKQRIKIMLLRGMSIQMILQRLSMDARRCRQYALTVKGKRPTRDDFVTYDDVANVLRSLMNKEIQKDPWENVSAIRWMEELRCKEYFTFYDTCDMPKLRKDGVIDKRGEFHGFASKWQIDQLLEYGETLCFDGTHNIYG